MKTMSQDQLQAHLEKIAFEEAKKSGLASDPAEVRVTLTIRTSIYSELITESDWKVLFALDLTAWEREVIDDLKKENNARCVLFERSQFSQLSDLTRKVKRCASPLLLTTRSGREITLKLKKRK